MRYSIGFVVLMSTFLSLCSIGGVTYVAYDYFNLRLSTSSGDSVEGIDSLGTTAAMTEQSTSVADLIEKVNPAVVSVVATRDVPIYERYYEEYDPWGGLFGGFAVPRVRERGTEEREVGGGSGFFVTADGMLVTNRHVVSDDAARYTIVTNAGAMYEVDVVAKDPVLDIAILQVTSNADTPDSFPFLGFGDSETLRLGESVVVIGNALAEFRNSASVGIVSGLARTISAQGSRGQVEQLEQVIQTDAAINPGNSGGPMVNSSGEVIGVSVATSRGADNISFALPASAVARVVASVIEYGEIQRPYLGVRYTMVTPRIQELNNLPVSYGALISRGETRDELAVLPGSPAGKAGIMENDIIVAIDGVSLEQRSLASILREKKVEEDVVVDLIHQGEEKQVTVMLEKMP